MRHPYAAIMAFGAFMFLVGSLIGALAVEEFEPAGAFLWVAALVLVGAGAIVTFG